GYNVAVRDFPVEEPQFDRYKEWAAKDKSDIYIFHTVPLCARLDLHASRFLDKTKPIIFFGPQPTFDPEQFLKRDKFYALRGEVEETIKDLVKAIKNGKGFEKVLGLTYVKKGKVYSNPGCGYIKDINKIPIPNRRLIKYKKYRNPKLPKSPYTTMMTSRACSSRCYYCVPMSLTYAREVDWKRSGKKFKPPVTIRDPENIYEELKDIKRLGIRSISIVDDQFVWGKERHLKICRYLKKIGLPFGILARSDRLCDEEIVKALADAGCIYVDMGIESFDQKILDYVGKDLKVETIEKSINLLKKYNITPKLNILYGSCPLETKKTLRGTLEKAKKLDIDFVQFAVASPFPGTEFRERAIKEGWIREKDVGKADPSKRSLVSYPHLSQKYLDYWVKHSFRSFYLRPKIIFRRLLKIRNVFEIFTYLRGFFRLIKE
ncbi:radical SAM protein, partial [Candidatus Woesearchaeota archaeon]|nr:radical SAM protein [Candidatus Woesearchaeota archaeon]